MTISEETGLPEAPKGMFWRVESRYSGGYENIIRYNYVTLTLMQKVMYKISRRKFPYFWKFSTETVNEDRRVLSEQLAEELSEVTPALIQRKADLILAKYQARQKALSLLGDYPPNSLIEV